MSTPQARCLETVARSLVSDVDGWGHEPAPERWLVHYAGAIEVRVRLQINENGLEVTLHIPTPDDTVDVVWLGIVSHRLGEGYATYLVDAMVQTYLNGYWG